MNNIKLIIACTILIGIVTQIQINGAAQRTYYTGRKVIAQHQQESSNNPPRIDNDGMRTPPITQEEMLQQQELLMQQVQALKEQMKKEQEQLDELQNKLEELQKHNAL